MVSYKWFKSRPGWARHAIVGALTYPAILLIIYFLAFITTPIGLRPLFESVISWVLYPAYYPSLQIVYNTVSNPNSYFLYLIGLVFFFSLLIGSIVGSMVFSFRSVYGRIK